MDAVQDGREGVLRVTAVSVHACLHRADRTGYAVESQALLDHLISALRAHPNLKGTQFRFCNAEYPVIHPLCSHSPQVGCVAEFRRSIEASANACSCPFAIEMQVEARSDAKAKIAVKSTVASLRMSRLNFEVALLTPQFFFVFDTIPRAKTRHGD